MKKFKLGDITTKIGSGATPRGGEKNYTSSGIAFIRSQNVQDFYFDYSNLAFINDEQAEQLSGVEIYPNDILLNITGDSVARCTIVPNNILPARVSQHVSIIRCRENFNSKYIMYYLQSLKEYLLSICRIGGTRNALTKEMLENLPITLKDDSNEIAAVLSGFDDKISLNKKINSSLEEMAKTIYLHNFFRKPTNAKISDILIENANSTISVGDAKESCGDFPFFTSGENILRWDEKIVDGRNIFFNTGGNVGIDFYVGDSAYSTDTWSITAENLADYLYLFLDTIKSEIGKKYFRGTALKHLQKDLLRSHKIYIPSATELDAFNRIIQPCFNKISENLRENYQLAKVRDWLLPLLMNGQLNLEEIKFE